jgi:HrpA-like RNA helicase
LLESNDIHSIANLFCKYDDDNLNVNTANEMLNDAIIFSRLLYDLKPLDMFPFDENSSGGKNINVFNIDEEVMLKCIEIVTRNIENNSIMDNSYARRNKVTPLIEIVIEVIRFYTKESAGGEEVLNEQNNIMIMTMEQERALQYFANNHASIENLSAANDNNNNNGLVARSLSAIIHKNIDSYDGSLQYHNIQFSKMYQKICKIVLFFLIDNNVPSKGLNPMYWYHGPTFHMLASKNFCRVTSQYKPSGRSALLIEPTQFDNSSNNNNCSEPASTEEINLTNDNGRKATLNLLPIEKHRDRICKQIRNNRITIIHGETGCGKSSRLPQMIIDDVGLENVKMFISQPRRIAATSLRTRVSQEIKKKLRSEKRVLAHDLDSIVGLRMGHGVKTVDTCSTRIWFCTAGYLVLVAAHHPEIFRDHTHLIIDEIHERSVDTDLLCYIAKDLLKQFPNLKLILMSATLAADTYREYFDVDSHALFVGSRRCALKEYYLNDLLSKRLNIQLGHAEQKNVAKLIKSFDQKASLSGSSNSGISSFSESQCKIAFHLSRVVGVPGRSVLIFVDGINAIYNIVSMFDQIKTRAANKEYLVIPIHSHIPHEEQMAAFDINKNVIKIVVATNSAESSITLPDCDNVICLGTEKRIEYNATKHQVCLVPAWISKASATQRAGRTARIRPGTVWRMYTKSLHDKFDPFDPPEILQTPLDHIILRLRAMLNRPVVSILENVITSPDSSQIQPAFDSLHRLSFFSEPSDNGELTTEGTLAATIGLDLSLCKLVIHGIRLGVGREAACIAAALSLERSPFRTASHFIHSSEEMNNIITTTLLGQIKFDDGHYSIPIMLLRILIWYRINGDRNLAQYGLVRSRLKTFNNTAKHLEAKINKFTGSNGLLVDPSKDSYVANALRLALFWVFSNQIVVTKSKFVPDVERNKTILQLKGSSEVQVEDIVRVLQGNFTDAIEIKDVHLRHFTVHHKFKNGCEHDLEMVDCINESFKNILFASFSKDIHVRWIRDIANKSGTAYILKDWVDSGNPNAERIKCLISKTFLSDGVLTNININNGENKEEDILFYAYETIGNDYISNNSTGKFKYLRSVCPTFIEICIEKMRNKVLHHVNVKGCKVVKKSFLNNIFPDATKVSNSSTNKNIRSIIFHSDDNDYNQNQKKNSIINDLPVALRILMNIQSRTNIRRHAIFVSKQIDDVDKAGEYADDEPLCFELVGDVSATWTFESTEWVKDVLIKNEQKPLVGNLSFISVALNHCAGTDKTNKIKNSNDMEQHPDVINTGNNSLVRGVCASALLVGKSMSIVVVDNITLLPPGEEWYNRAYDCITHKNNRIKRIPHGKKILISSIYETIQDSLVMDGSLKKRIMKLFPEYNGVWGISHEEVDWRDESKTVEDELQQGNAVNLERMKVSAQLLRQRISKLERLNNKTLKLISIINEQKEKLNYLQTQINTVIDSNYNINNHNCTTTTNNNDRSAINPVIDYIDNRLVIESEDEEEEEILLKVHIPSKKLQ